MMFNLVGGLLWAVGVTMAGYALGSVFPPETLDRYFLIIVVAVIAISVLPTALHLWGDNKEQILAWVKALPNKADRVQENNERRRYGPALFVLIKPPSA
jgi:drug/metabolite transporter (DMT)-like permease